MSQVKGTILGSAVAFLRLKLGEEGYRGLVRTLPAEDESLLLRPVLPGNWYRFGLLIDLMRAAEGKVFLASGRSLPWEMGRHSAETNLNGTFKLFVRVAETGYLMRRATEFFSAYYDSGTMSVVAVGDRIAIFRITDFDEPSPLFCERLQGWCQRTMELAGHTHVNVRHPRCAAKGDPFCEYVGEWK